MSRIKSLRTIKWVVPVLMVIITLSAAFALGTKGNNVSPATSSNNVHVYEFMGDPTDKQEVEDLSNWVYKSTGSSCDDVNSPKACTILVDDSHKSIPTLADGSNLAISANNNMNSTYFRVVTASDGTYSATVSNQYP